MAGVVPRPEITGNDLRALKYWVRRLSLKGNRSPIDPGPEDSDDQAPVISQVSTNRVNPTALRVNWRTQKPTLGIVHHGVDAAPERFMDRGIVYTRYPRWSAMESDYSLDHSVVLQNLPPNKPTHFAIRAKDRAGNQTVTADTLVNPDGTSCTGQDGDLNCDGLTNVVDLQICVNVATNVDRDPDHRRRAERWRQESGRTTLSEACDELARRIVRS
ncbi:MAG: hypothetical protein HYZ73_01470 [Elusimicrobia bacterium]|nr:hypothetical protein [Elusimicrobiota bacterium]